MTETDGVPNHETRMTELAAGVYAYVRPHGWGQSNGGLIVGDDWAIIVDTQFTNDLNAGYMAAMRSVTGKPVRYVVNTHWHGDHTFGNRLFGGARTVYHERCRSEVLRKGQANPAFLKQSFPMYDFTGVSYPMPDISFNDRLTLYQGEREVRLLYWGPAHSVTDIVVHLPREKVVYAGDLLFLGAAPLGIESSFDNWLACLDRLAGLDAEHFVPGHGPICGREGVLEARGYLEYIHAEARRRFDAGMEARQAALEIGRGKYGDIACWERILVNVERLYREFRGEEPTSPVDLNTLLAEMDRLAPRA